MNRNSVVVLDHISVNVRDLRAARRFYEAALGAIGMKVNMDVSTALGMGSKNEKIFWLARDRKATGGGHYALRVDDRKDVDAFHEAAMQAGGKENGEPGPRPSYGRNYYAAFVKDAEGNNIEVVCYAGSGAKRAGAKHAGAKRTMPKRTMPKRTVAKRAGAKRTGSPAKPKRGARTGRKQRPAR
jgi:catechol 2,3-dioxygenase-like lactoylglutathione lyase family enzyme